MSQDTSANETKDSMSAAGCYHASRQMDPEERERLLLEHLPQVQYIARRIHDRLPAQVPLEDLINAGVVGLIEALDRFDPSKNVLLKSFAKFRIRGAILDSLRGLDWGSRHTRRQGRRIEEAIRKLNGELNRAPSQVEIAAELQMELSEFQQLLGELRSLNLGSLDDVGSDQDGAPDGLAEYRPDASVRDPFFLCLRSEMKVLLADAIGELGENERQVLALYYTEELTMKEVGLVLGVSESRVSQIHSAALLQVRVRLQESMKSRETADSRKR
jgi:RNA polymerase sigma factor FliA